MVKTLAPMFSLMAQGQLGKALSYVNATFGSYCKVQSSRNIENLPNILTFQSNLRATVEQWQRFLTPLKTAWNSWAKTYTPQQSGYNAFCSYYLHDINAGIPPIFTPPTS
jgi:hypothetical protein